MPHLLARPASASGVIHPASDSLLCLLDMQLDELQADLKLAKAGKEKKHAQSGKLQKLDPAT